MALKKNMSRARSEASVSLLAATLIASIGCDRGDQSDDEAVAACAAAGSMAACAAVDVGSMYRCAWVRTLTLTSEPECATSEVFRCLAYPNTPATPGCAPIPGCHDSGPDKPGTLVIPAYREGESGSFELVDQCGSSGVVGFTACTSGSADAEVPACACVCESAP
jgi:hypothetical protein